MRMIFISPLLWKRFNRAVRRREEGQALVIITFAAVALVAVVGLSVDGAMTFWQAQSLQRAADAAALAGVVWVPNQLTVADYRGRLTVQAGGYDTFSTSGSVQQPRTYDQMMAGSPGQYTVYWSSMPLPYQYKVVLGTKIPRYFLGVLGFGDMYLQREATAEFAQPARLGGSFNYFGSSSLKYDWIIRDQAFQGTGAEQEYYTILWQRYINERCDQTPSPAPCVGGFWLNTFGPESYTGNGDAYSPIGTNYSIASGGPYTGSYYVNNGSSAVLDNGHCLRTSDIQTWNFTINSGTNCNTNANNPLETNHDFHPDSGNTRGFGYSIAVQVDANALRPSNSYTNTTGLRISVYDAAEADVGSSENIATGDANWGWGNSNYAVRSDKNLMNTRPGDTDRAKTIGNRSTSIPRTVTCTIDNLPAVTSQSRVNSAGQVITGGDVGNDDQYCQNYLRTRFSLYYPPSAPGIPTTWRTKGDLVAAFEALNLTAAGDEWDASGAAGGKTCYYADTSYVAGANASPTSYSPTTQLVFACPAARPNSTNVRDIYWNNASGNTTFSNLVPTATIDPSQECRSVVDSTLYDSTTDYNNALNLSAKVNPPYRNTHTPYNLRGGDPVYTGPNAQYTGITGIGTLTGGYKSYHGWRCSWDFDSSNTLNPGTNNGLQVVDTERQQAEGVTSQPYLFISDYGNIGGTMGRISYKNGIRQVAGGSDERNVRGGVYLLQVQVFGGSGTNRYAVKAEYDNPQTVNYCFANTSGGGTTCKNMWPVPQVYGISTMSLFVNAVNNNSGALNVIFDLANIPKQNAGSLATLELYDPGDVATDLYLEILMPSGYGQKLNGGVVPYNTSQRIPFTVVVCPQQYGGNSATLCTQPSSQVYQVGTRVGGNQYFNAQWLYMIFRIPDATTYDTIGQTCNAQQVPEQLCYYYQVNYKMQGGGSASDTTTWQLQIRNQPVHLIVS